ECCLTSAVRGDVRLAPWLLRTGTNRIAHQHRRGRPANSYSNFTSRRRTRSTASNYATAHTASRRNSSIHAGSATLRALIILALDTGVRAGEMLAIWMDDVELDPAS